jgi:predicted transcriptional regulator
MEKGANGLTAAEQPVSVTDRGQGSASARPSRDELLRFVERFAIALTNTGLQRMPARVFAYVLIDDAERYTAGELSQALQVSPAAISGALRTLVQAGLLGKEREPGARIDTYRVYDDNLWNTIVEQRSHTIDPITQLADEGVRLLGADTLGGRRMLETREFYRFLDRRLADLLAEWQQHKEQLG